MTSSTSPPSSTIRGASPVPPRKKLLRLRRADPVLMEELRREAAGLAGQDGGGANAAAQLEEELAQAKETLLRARADFDNLRKRAAREKEETKKFALQELLRDLVPIVDNFDRAIASKESVASVENFTQGVEMIFKQLWSLLELRGVEKVDPKGEVFDPNFHEAVSTFPPENPEDENKVREVIQPGYMLNGRVVRPAMVVISKAVSQ